MPDESLLQRIHRLEADNARLRRRLERRGETAGLRHQVRNTVAMVRDVVRQSLERFEDSQGHMAHLEARLDAVFRIQNTISNCPPDGVALDLLVADELLAHGAREDERLSIAGPDVQLQPAAAGPLALAIHELAINAVKFGALSAPKGRIAVSWAAAAGRDGQPWLTLRWIESGVDLVPQVLPHRGFGSAVVEDSLRYQLGGDGALELAPGGLRCTIRLPLAPWIGGLRAADGRPATGFDNP